MLFCGFDTETMWVKYVISEIISQAIYYLCPNISIVYKKKLPGLRHYSENIVSHANTFFPHI